MGMDISMIGSFGFRAGAFAITFLMSLSPALAGFVKVSDSHEGVIVIYGTQPNGFARDCADAECKSGPVSIAIADALKKPGITIAGFFDAVNAGVAAGTQRTQIPSISASTGIDVPLRNNSGKSFALVIGNGAYAHFTPLTGSPHDAAIVGKSLSNSGFETTTLIDAKLSDLTKAIEDFLSHVGKEDTAVVYYSGHGLSFSGAGYLPAIDAPLSDGEALTATSVRVEALIAQFSAAPAAKRILILDTHFPQIEQRMSR
jgi:uncharacterized caspase-like protein